MMKVQLTPKKSQEQQGGYLANIVLPPFDFLVIKYNLYLAYKKKLAPRTIRCYTADLKLFSKFASREHLEIIDINKENIVHFLRVQYNSKSSLARSISCLRTFFKWLQKNGYRQDMPVDKTIKTPKVDPNKRQELTVFQMKKLLKQMNQNNFSAIRDLAIFSLILHCGFSLDELLKITLGNIHLTERKIKANLLIKTMSNTSFSALEKYLQARKDRGDILDLNNILFVNKFGNHISSRSLRKRLKDYAKKAGMDVTPIQLRHSYALSALRAGMSLSELQLELGHAQRNTTQMYIRQSEKIK